MHQNDREIGAVSGIHIGHIGQADVSRHSARGGVHGREPVAGLAAHVRELAGEQKGDAQD